ncbi:Uncharacterised protein [Mycobacteroides abscessus]|nr:Uncharacterised protein [Mycobacteroides abscessus]CPX67808.1 Uncharacterised protein [Mycobacteroides abscessus]CPZ70074.1 Uncharacterised protein [Mycobacteroides abscessus]
MSKPRTASDTAKAGLMPSTGGERQPEYCDSHISDTAQGVSGLSATVEVQRSVVGANDSADVLDSFASCLGLTRLKVAYVSTPITTGRRYYDWLSASRKAPTSIADQSAGHRTVINANEVSAHTLVKKVRAHYVHLTIVDPTALRAATWSQNDFHDFWARLITNYVGRVIFNEGWEYSTGCCMEYAAAIDAGAELLDATLSPLPPSLALVKTQSAVDRLLAEGHSVANLVAARERIMRASINWASASEESPR